MKLSISGNTLTVTREPGDPMFRRSGWCPDAGSQLLYHVKRLLNKAGCDLIKKRMARDGHLVDDMQQYLRTRKATSKGPHIYVSDNMWSIRCSAEEFNKEGATTLMLAFDVFSKQPDCESWLAEVAARL